MKYIKDFFTSKSFKRFVWLTAEGFLTALITYFSGISWAYSPLIMAFLTNVIKFINVNYLQRAEILRKVL